MASYELKWLIRLLFNCSLAKRSRISWVFFSFDVKIIVIKFYFYTIQLLTLSTIMILSQLTLQYSYLHNLQYNADNFTSICAHFGRTDLLFMTSINHVVVAVISLVTFCTFF